MAVEDITSKPHKSHSHGLKLSDDEKRILTPRLLKHAKNNSKTGCIEWNGANVLGYGQIGWNGKRLLSHRVMYAASKGDIPPGMCVCHKCDNPRCINPEHMFLGDHADNMKDMVNKKRHVEGERVGSAKLTFADIQAMQIWSKTGMPQKKIAAKFDVGQDTVSRNLNGKRWKHLMLNGD